MLLKFKNKHLMALDKMIKEAKEAGGMIDSIILDPKEALGLLMELSDLGAKYMTDMTMRDREGEDQIRKELLWGEGDGHERGKKVIQLWYKTEYEVKYKTIKLVVVKPKPKAEGWMNSTTGPLDVPKPPPVDDIPERPAPPAKPPSSGAIAISSPPTENSHWNTMAPPPPPKPPPGRIIREGVIGICDKCNSSLKTKWFFFKPGGCIQPECENYWEKNKR